MEIQKLSCTDSKIEALKKINAIIENGGSGINDKITNCLLEVPQRINAEPSDVYLMLKAGSIVSVSTNGTFEDVIIEENVYLGSDTLTTPEGTRDLFACYVPSLNEIRNIPCDAMHCQATAPESNDTNLLIGLYGGWLDTSTNTMKFTYDGGVTWEICSLPFALGHPSFTTWIGKVKQIFNGFGFAGKSIWVDKGVKYLVAKGRNDDGSLKNYEVEIPELRLTTFTNTLNKYAILNFAGSVIGGTADFITSSKQPTVSNTSLWYNPDTNITSNVLADGTIISPYYEMACGTLEYLSTGRIKSFIPYQPFRAVDYGDYKTSLNNCLNKSQITNCILEVPQRIKLELNNGVLTLKAGSEVIVPNGFKADGVTPKFDYVTITNDIVNSNNAGNITGQWLYFYNRAGNSWGWELTFRCVSGNPLPISTSGENRVGYNTGTNKMQQSVGGGAYYDVDISLPVCIFSTVDGVITSIDQVFNGMGGIGSTIWTDKGVKILAPDGRNEDGTLKSKQLETSKLTVWPIGLASNVRYVVFIHPEAITHQMEFFLDFATYEQNEPPTIASTGYQIWYNPKENKWRYVLADVAGGWREDWRICKGFYLTTGANGTISEIKSFEPFRAVDWNDFSNTPHVTETYVNGTSWYRVYSDGWCEQGGRITKQPNPTTVALLKSFANTNYSVSTQCLKDGNAFLSEYETYIGSITTTSFAITAGSASRNGTNVESMIMWWEAKGYIL